MSPAGSSEPRLILFPVDSLSNDPASERVLAEKIRWAVSSVLVRPIPVISVPPPAS